MMRRLRRAVRDLFDRVTARRHRGGSDHRRVRAGHPRCRGDRHARPHLGHQEPRHRQAVRHRHRQDPAGLMTRRVRPARRSACPESGQATVEFALVLPLVVVLILAVLQTALVVRDYVATVHAAREAARAASVDRRPGRAARRGAPGAAPCPRRRRRAPRGGRADPRRGHLHLAHRSPARRAAVPGSRAPRDRDDAGRAVRRSERGGVAIFGLVAGGARRHGARRARSGRRGRGTLGPRRHRRRCGRARRGRGAGPAEGSRRGARRGGAAPRPTTAARSSGATAPATTPRSWWRVGDARGRARAEVDRCAALGGAC